LNLFILFRKSNNLDWNNLQNDVLVKLLSSSEKIKFDESEIGEVKNLIIRLEILISVFIIFINYYVLFILFEPIMASFHYF
jgi:hypothetical protein